MKKITFLFITTFILALVFFSSYLVVQEVRGKVVNVITLDMGNHKITDILMSASDSDILTRSYLKALPELILKNKAITTWCDVQYFDWCSGEDDYPEGPVCGDGTCDPSEDGSCHQDCCGNGTCAPGENEFTCPDDCPCILSC